MQVKNRILRPRRTATHPASSDRIREERYLVPGGASGRQGAFAVAASMFPTPEQHGKKARAAGAIAPPAMNNLRCRSTSTPRAVTYCACWTARWAAAAASVLRSLSARASCRAALPQAEAAVSFGAGRPPHVHASEGRPGQSQECVRGESHANGAQLVCVCVSHTHTGTLGDIQAA
jgi:hypothetical protein